MNVVVVSCNHHNAALEVRERLAFANDGALKTAYAQWQNSHPDSELVVLSTCNRVEIYAAQESTNDIVTASDLASFISSFHDLPADTFADSLLSHDGADAVRHLFQVVCSIDSMVLGEPQIVNQVKEAYRVAREHLACGPLTNVLFQRALRVSAEVRSQTRLAEGRVSIASVAVGEFGRSIFNRFDNKTVLVIGAGEMAEETLQYLRSEGVGRITVINRSLQHGETLAEQFGGHTAAWDALDDHIAQADVIVSTTGSEQPIVDAARLAAARAKSKRRPVFILDLGAPRDFAPDAANVDDNVFLYNIDDLETTCRHNRMARHSEIRKAQTIIDRATETFMRDIYHRATGPVVKRLREQWDEVSQQELDSLFRRLPEMPESDREQIERTVRRIMNKLLHPPLEALKDEAADGEPHGLLNAIRHLFGLLDD